LSDDPTGITKPNDFINVIGDLSFSDSVYFIINKLNTTVTPGDYALFHYTGSFTGNLNKITVIGIPGIKYTIVDRNDTILLNIAAMRPASGIIWTGDVNAIWDLATTANWLKGETPEIFVTGDTVGFIDNNPQYTTVIISGISPSIGSMVVDASTDYSFAGTGSLIGTGGITKTGSGKLNISNSNSFTGNVSFTGGSLEIASLANGGVASSIGAGSIASSSFKLDNINVRFIGASCSTNRGLTLVSDTISMEVGSGKSISIGGIIAGAGKLVKTGTGTLNLTATNTYTGGTILKSGVILTGDIGNPLGSGLVTLDGGTLTMGSSDAYTTCNSNFYVPDGSAGTLNTDLRCNYYGTLTGGGTLNLYLPGTIDRTIFFGDWSAFTGIINVSGTSRFRLASTNYVGSTINLATGVTMYHSTGTTGGDAVATTINIGALSGVSGSYLTDENWVIGAKNVNTTFAGAISGNSLTKVGTGVLTLTGINTYTGGTAINSGKILLSGSSNGFGTGLVNVNNTAILAGTGSVKAPIAVNSGGTIAVGNLFGSLLVNNNVTFKSGSVLAVNVNSTTNTSSKLYIVGSFQLILNGTLQLTEVNSASYSAGNSFTIFSGSNITGNFENIIPATPGNGLVWDTTSLRSSGIIKVITDPNIYAPELDNIVTVKIYPNPVKDYVYLETEKTYKEFSVRVLNSLGLPENVFIEKLYTGTQINLSSLSEGIYILQIVIDGKTIYKKIVKE
jgi:autotransporter-associated beta strand protein